MTDSQPVTPEKEIFTMTPLYRGPAIAFVPWDTHEKGGCFEWMMTNGCNPFGDTCIHCGPIEKTEKQSDKNE